MTEEINPKLIPELNLITVGHVDHGKTSLTQALSGKWTDVHSEEIKRGITLRLGYADVTIYYCKVCDAYCSTNKCAKCFGDCEPQRTFSIVDAPGHETLMATVLAGSAIADGALFVIAANEKCPQPQTREHLAVLGIAGIKNIIIVQTKIDLVSEEKALENYKQIKEFVKGGIAENAEIVPVSAQQKINVEYLLKAIQEKIPTPERSQDKPRMMVARSFDINKPGSAIQSIKGGVLGGSIIQGKLSLGESIEIRPGVKRRNKYESLQTKIIGLQKAGLQLQEAGAGGLLGLLTELDPSLTKADSLAGSVVGLAGSLPETRQSLRLEIKSIAGSQIKSGDTLMLTVGTARTVGVVKLLKKNYMEIELKLPVCCDAGDRVAISQKLGDRWKLSCWGTVV